MSALTPTLDAPDPTPVLALHRGADGYVCFRGGPDGNTRDMFSVRAGKLAEMFPQMRHHLIRDAYFSVNGFWRKGLRPSHFDSRHELVWRRQENLRYLNACFIDLDAYKLGMTVGEMTGKVIDAANAKLIPAPSITANSGRGLWAFWLLHDPANDDSPQRAFGDRIDLYCKVQRAIADRLSHLMPDARDAVRVVRVPNSLNGKSDAVVRYNVFADSAGRGFTYALKDLATFLDVKPKQYHQKVLAALDEPEREMKRKAWEALQANRLRQFEVLRSLRGGFREGCRNRAALLYAHLLAKNRVAAVDVERQLDELADECRPPLKRSERRGTLKSGRDMKTGHCTISNKTIAEWLDITPAESEQLES